MLHWILLLLLAVLYAPRGGTKHLPLVFTTANIEAKQLPDAARRAIAIACRNSDLVALQEMHSRYAEQFLPSPAWGVAGPKGRNVFLYRKQRLRLLKWQTGILNAAMGLTFPAAARTYIWARFQDLETGRYFTVACVHFVPHADDEKGALTRFPRRRNVAGGVDTIIRLAKGKVLGSLVVLGDWNWDAIRELAHRDPADLEERLSTVGLVDVQRLMPDKNPTHGRNQYDRIFLRLIEGAYVGEDWTHEDGPGDHLAYSARVWIPLAPGYPKR